MIARVRCCLNRSTIKAVVDGLAESGLLSERLPAQRSGAGRPSLLVLPRPQAAVVLAVDVRVNRVSMALVGLGGENLGRCSWRLRAGAGTPREVVTRVVESAGTLADELGAPVVAAGISVPGVVRRTDGLVRKAPQLRWVDVPLGEQLSAALRMPVAVASDGELSALAEHTRGVARGASNVVVVVGDIDSDIEANYTDTHGTSIVGFASTHLGYRLLPRLKNIGAARLYRPTTRSWRCTARA